MSRIVWLASYPKSGNTWLRVFIANLLRGTDVPVDINELRETPLAAARDLIDDTLGPELSELTPDEIIQARSATYDVLAGRADRTLYFKTHDAFARASNGLPLFPKSATRCVLYLVRNPLDVAVSFAHHLAAPIGAAIRVMRDPEHDLVMQGRDGVAVVPQRLGTWSGHVESWLDSGLPVHMMRYEDMLERPFETFSAAAAFADLPTDEERVRQAIVFSTFDQLQAQEKERGFGEKSRRTESFFRSGTAGSWRERLDDEQVRRLMEDHGRTMRRLGYLEPAPVD